MVKFLVFIPEQEGIKKIDIKHGQKRIGDVMRNFYDLSKARKFWGGKYYTL
jgi:hypothetical protein